jgi:hypothetical protein
MHLPPVRYTRWAVPHLQSFLGTECIPEEYSAYRNYFYDDEDLFSVEILEQE